MGSAVLLCYRRTGTEVSGIGLSGIKGHKNVDADSKPNILAIGHYHKIEYMFHRNVHCFQTGCFQSQTPFARGKGISVHMGGWIVTVEVDKNGYVQRIIPKMIPYYKGVQKDYLNFERAM